MGGESKENNNNKRDPMENVIIDHEKLVGEDNMKKTMKKNRGQTSGCVSPTRKWRIHYTTIKSRLVLIP